MVSYAVDPIELYWLLLPLDPTARVWRTDKSYPSLMPLIAAKIEFACAVDNCAYIRVEYHTTPIKVVL